MSDSIKAKLSHAVPPRARLMIGISVLIVVVVAIIVLNSFGSNSDAPIETAEVNVNLNPSESSIRGTRPGDVPIVPPNSEIAQTIRQESERQMQEAQATGNSLTQPIFIPGQLSGGSQRQNQFAVAEDAPVDAIQEMMNERRDQMRQSREQQRVQGAASTSTGYSQAAGVFDPYVFLQNELMALNQSSGDIVKSEITRLAASEMAPRPEARVAGSTPRESQANEGSRSVPAGVSTTSADYLNGIIRQGGENSPQAEAARRLEQLGLSPGNQATRNASGQQNVVAPNDSTRMLHAGTILYAVLETPINSDNSEVVRATIVQEGPYKGAYVLGTVSLQDDAVIVKFDRMGHKGRDYSINAVAVDPTRGKDVTTFLADNVDSHILYRYGMLWGSAFLEGYADSMRNTTTVMNPNGGVITTGEAINNSRDQAIYATGRVGARMTPIMAQEFNRPKTVYVDGGRPIGLMLMQGLPY